MFVKKMSLAVLFFSASASYATTAVEQTNLSLHSLQQESNLSSYVTKRQVVEQLLQQAYQTFKQPAYISHAGFTAKMPSNMEKMASLLLQAYELEPYRVDLLFSAANAYVYNGDITKATELFNLILTKAKDDIDAHTYLAVWNKFLNTPESIEISQSHLARLLKLNKNRYDDLMAVFNTIETIVQTPLTSDVITTEADKSAIVTLGYVLSPDGSMNPILIQRLEKTLELAKANPKALIVLTGGVPKNNKTEGNEMAAWLIEKGVNPHRLIAENYATSTVDNALYSSYILSTHGIEEVIVVSSASHVRRAQSLLEIALDSKIKHVKVSSVSALDKDLEELKTPSAKELLGIYRDALRVYGLWSYRSAPLMER